MKQLPAPRPALLWFGLLINILPLNLNMLGLLTIDQAAIWMDIIWIPSVVIMLASFDFNMLSLLMVMKAMELSLGHRFYPFYIGLNVPLAQVVALLVLAAVFSLISYSQRRVLRRCSSP